MKSPITIRLLAAPTQLSMSERDRFRIGLVATNTSDEAVDPHLYATQLLVNGEPSPAFDLALGNSVVPAKWDLLPPGDTTPPIEWPLGAALFPSRASTFCFFVSNGMGGLPWSRPPRSPSLCKLHCPTHPFGSG